MNRLRWELGVILVCGFSFLVSHVALRPCVAKEVSLPSAAEDRAEAPDDAKKNAPPRRTDGTNGVDKIDEDTSKQGDPAEGEDRDVAKDAKDPDEEDDSPTDQNAKSKADQKDKKHVVLKGGFVAKRSEPISIAPGEWKEWKVISVVPHGTEVQKDDVLIEFDAENLDLAVKDTEYDVQLNRLSVSQAEVNLRLRERSSELAVRSAEQAARQAAEDLARYLAQELDQEKESLAFSLKSAGNYLAYQEEELKQLQQMYEADDLTEQTEEIILRRTKDNVDRARFSLKRTEQSHDRTMEVKLPRRKETLEQTAATQEVELQRAHSTVPAKIKEEQLKLEKSRLALHKAEKRLERLRQDRELATLKAPMGGIVYYGEPKKGKWSDPDAVAATLAPAAPVKPNRTLLTIVKPRPLAVQATVSEEDLRFVRPGTRGVVIPKAFPDRELKAQVTEVSLVPLGTGNFLADIRISLPDDDELLMPGMTCEVKLKKL